MKRALLLGAVLLAAGFGCVTRTAKAPFMPPRGLLITAIRAPVMTEFNHTPVRYEKGEASSYYFRECVFRVFDLAVEPCDLISAGKAGGLGTVDYADYQYVQVLGTFSICKVTAYGSR